MATVTKPIALNESFNTTEVTPRNIADVLAEGLSHITGRTASEVEYDNTDSGLTADNVQDALDEIVEDIPTVPSVDIQTAVDEFSTYNGGILDSLKVSLTPNQDLHGYDSPWVGGAGKNRYDMGVATNVVAGITYTRNSDGTYTATGTATGSATLVGQELSLSAGTYMCSALTDGSSDINASVYVNGVWKFSITTSSVQLVLSETSNVKFHLYIANGQTVNKTFYPMIRLATESDPTFEPYSNICPISGHTQVDVDISDGETTQEQVTVNLGGTYYSGVLDVVSGELTVDSAFIASYNGETLPSTWISDRDVYAVGTTPTTGAEVCYKLATPTPIQLSPTMVKALVGENHLSAPLEGQEITESKYKQMFTFDDVIAYIQSLS